MIRELTKGCLSLSGVAAVSVRHQSSDQTLTASNVLPSVQPSLPFRVEDLVRGQRRALSKAITMVESDNPAHAQRIGHLLRDVRSLRERSHLQTFLGVLPRVSTTAQRMKARCPRIAVSGSPGAGKSCFIEAFGLYLCETLGFNVGVICVDPSSSVSHGSILGDKTRMERLGLHPKAYVRPSPSRGHLGGVTARCWEVMELMEGAGFDVVLVETVGVGQSEIEIKYMTDIMLLLVPPASGDELQGIKKGIVEVADMVVVTKNDGERAPLAQQTKVAYTRATQYTMGDIIKPVVAVSSEEKKNIPEAWEALSKVWVQKEALGLVDSSRREQRMMHFKSYFQMELIRRATCILQGGESATSTKSSINHWAQLEAVVQDGGMTPREAGEVALNTIFGVKSCE